MRNENNLHKLAAKFALTNVTDMSKIVWKWNIADIRLKSQSKMLHLFVSHHFLNITI